MNSTSPHRKRVKHFHEPGDLHELTFSCYRRMPLLTNDPWREQLARSIDEANRQAGMQLVAFVFMPEHVHLLVRPSSALATANSGATGDSGGTGSARACGTKPSIGRYLALVKQPFSKSIKLVLAQTQAKLLEQLTVRERPGKTCFRFWQEGPGYDRNLQTPESIQASIDYIHCNPVKRGLCSKAIDWKWSSARWYMLDPPRVQVPELPLIHGL